MSLFLDFKAFATRNGSRHAPRQGFQDPAKHLRDVQELQLPRKGTKELRKAPALATRASLLAVGTLLPYTRFAPTNGLLAHFYVAKHSKHQDKRPNDATHHPNSTHVDTTGLLSHDPPAPADPPPCGAAPARAPPPGAAADAPSRPPPHHAAARGLGRGAASAAKQAVSHHHPLRPVVCQLKFTLTCLPQLVFNVLSCLENARLPSPGAMHSSCNHARQPQRLQIAPSCSSAQSQAASMP